MSQSVFRNRGIPIEVDTASSAELDIAGFQISGTTLDAIGNSLKAVPFSDQDRLAGAVRVRTLLGYEIAFVLTRQDRSLVITIGAIRPPDPAEPLEEKLKRLGVIATIRGAAGI